jgi:KDO2-lipid IV(A) lauroyltransferase
MTEAPATKSQARLPWRYHLEYMAAHLLRTLARVPPEPVARGLGACLGRGVGRLWGTRRRIAIENVDRAFNGELPQREINRIVNETFETMGQTIFEVLRFGKLRPHMLLDRVEGNADALRQARGQDKGAILVSGHFGNWEILGAWLRALGYPVDLIVKPMRNPLVDALYNRCRASMDVGVIHTQIATKGIIRALQQKRFVAILVDQYAGAEGIEVDFFGRPASTPRGPAALALKFGCPLLSGVLERRPGGRFLAHVDGPVEYQPTGDTEADIRAITQELTSRLEKHIRRTPGQWLWTHRRWRD